MAVDEAGGVAPSREWMQAAQRALETDGILDGSPSKRHKVCICICTLMSQHTCTPKLLGESLSEDVPVRVSRAYILLERTLLFPKKRSLLKKGPLRLPPKSLPKHCRSTAEARSARARSARRARHLARKLPKTGFEPRTPGRRPGAKPAKQPCRAFLAWQLEHTYTQATPAHGVGSNPRGCDFGRTEIGESDAHIFLTRCTVG